MLDHELTFSDCAALLRAFERLADEGNVRDCEVDLERLQISFSTRAPLGEALRDAIGAGGTLVAARCTPARAPLFEFTRAVRRARDAGESDAAA